MKTAFIQPHQERFKVKPVSSLEVSRSGGYMWYQRPKGWRRQEDRRLGEKAETSYERSRKAYGARRI